MIEQPDPLISQSFDAQVRANSTLADLVQQVADMCDRLADTRERLADMREQLAELTVTVASKFRPELFEQHDAIAAGKRRDDQQDTELRHALEGAASLTETFKPE